MDSVSIDLFALNWSVCFRGAVRFNKSGSEVPFGLSRSPEEHEWISLTSDRIQILCWNCRQVTEWWATALRTNIKPALGRRRSLTGRLQHISGWWWRSVRHRVDSRARAGLQSQNAVFAHFTNKQILHFGFARQSGGRLKDRRHGPLFAMSINHALWPNSRSIKTNLKLIAPSPCGLCKGPECGTRLVKRANIGKGKSSRRQGIDCSPPLHSTSSRPCYAMPRATHTFTVTISLSCRRIQPWSH